MYDNTPTESCTLMIIIIIRYVLLFTCCHAYSPVNQEDIPIHTQGGTPCY